MGYEELADAESIQVAKPCIDHAGSHSVTSARSMARTWDRMSLDAHDIIGDNRVASGQSGAKHEDGEHEDVEAMVRAKEEASDKALAEHRRHSLAQFSHPDDCETNESDAAAGTYWRAVRRKAAAAVHTKGN